jgi:L-amino acid N-acyltransferase YncA
MYQSTDFHIRPALPDDAERVAAIYNQGIEERSSTFETRLRSVEEMRAAIASDYPMLVAIGVDDAVLGWASVSAYRARACYAGVAEFSIYLDRSARGRGIGKQLLAALLQAAAARGYWKLLSRVFPFNEASRALCRTCGFREVGIYEKHSKLDGAWLDVVIVEKLLSVNLT